MDTNGARFESHSVRQPVSRVQRLCRPAFLLTYVHLLRILREHFSSFILYVITLRVGHYGLSHGAIKSLEPSQCASAGNVEPNVSKSRLANRRLLSIQVRLVLTRADTALLRPVSFCCPHVDNRCLDNVWLHSLNGSYI